MKKSLGIYVHIPFCLKKCHYCDFCSFPGSDGERMRAYVKELCRRMVRDLPSPKEWQVDTVYFGGGTPTLLPIHCFEELMACLCAHTDLSPTAEITCECNPATADLSYLSALRALGVNRLSIGLQSVHDEELARIGRIHTYKDFLKTYRNSREAGFENVSVDLMYGLPDGSLDAFRQSLRTVGELSPEHISAYGLKIEEGTRFYREKDTLCLPDEDTEYEMYLAMTEILSSYGYKKYEISNFSKEGRPSRHNLRYWQGKDYLGFGVAAHSCFESVRFGNSRDMAAFLRGEDITEERVALTEEDRLSEYVMLSLRLAEGLCEETLKERFGIRAEELSPRLPLYVRDGYMTRKEGRLAFTDKGFFVSNSILSDLLNFG